MADTKQRRKYIRLFPVERVEDHTNLAVGNFLIKDQDTNTNLAEFSMHYPNNSVLLEQ